MSATVAAPGPRKTQLRRLLETPAARPRVRRAVVSLLGVGVFSIGIIGVLMIWHLVRRGRLIRDRLNPPKHVQGLEESLTTQDEQPPRGRS